MPGVTVAELTKQGAAPLDDVQLKALVVGKTLNVRNTVRGSESNSSSDAMAGV